MTVLNESTAPGDLSIRLAPAPVRRFSKKALAIILGFSALIILGSFSLALSPSGNDASAATRELYSTENKPKADGLASLPASYADIKQDEPVPELGPPLPGDLGAPILRAQRAGRFDFDERFEASAEIDELAEQVAQLEAERAAAARESGLFFSNSGKQAAPVDQVAAPQRAGLSDPFEVLNAWGPLTAGGQVSQDANFQQRKEDFISKTPVGSIYNPYQIQSPVSPWQVMAGTVIPATLLTGINSDLPGQIVGQVTEPVYDTVTGQTVLIPQGSRIVGRYDSVVAYGQSRALIVWNRIIMPDGTSIRIENLPGVDGRGNAGLKDRVNNHTLRIFSAAALSSLISVGAELSDDDDDRIARALRDATQDGASRASDEIIRRQLAVQPTITVRPGWRLRILVHQDIILQPYGRR
ncbi:MAG: TrbI/VirB10 family protein [Pseudomonadota bacterium]